MRLAVAFFVRGLREALSYRAAFALRLAIASVSLLAFYYFSRFIDAANPASLSRYGGDYLSYGLFGLVMLNLQHATVSAYPQVIRVAQLAGTLEAMLATPTAGWKVLLLAPAYRFVQAGISALALLLVGGLLMGLSFERANLPALLVAGPLSIIAFAALGFFGATLTMIMRRADPISMVLGGFSTLAGGVFFPPDVLPGWLKTAGAALPITHGLETLRRAAFDGATIADLGGPLLLLGAFCAIAVPLGLLSFVWAIRRSRRDGSLSHY